MNDQPDPVNPTSSPLRDDFVRLTERAALFQEAAAERLGLNVTDLRCLALAYAEPGMTASRLAESSGLTSGAITGVLDRLEQADLVRREADPADRRRTLIRGVPGREHDFRETYDSIEAAISRVRSTLDDRQQAGLDAFIAGASDAFQQETARLRAQTRGGMVDEMFTAPMGDIDAGRLVFASGAPRISLRAAPLGPTADARMVAELAHSTLRLTTGAHPGELCRATFSGPVPDIKANREGTVAVRYRSRLDWRARQASLGLSVDVPWTIEISGGLSGLSGDLRGLRLRAFDLRGGVDELELDLPAPDGTSRIHVSGSPANVTLLHPRGSAMRATVKGGIHELRFGAKHMRDVHGELRLETPGAGAAPDRYEVEITGGVRFLKITPA